MVDYVVKKKRIVNEITNVKECPFRHEYVGEHGYKVHFCGHNFNGKREHWKICETDDKGYTTFPDDCPMEDVAL